jgi:hypothetical protein
MHGHRGLQPQVQLIWAAVIWNDIPSRRPLINHIAAHTAFECIPRRIDYLKEAFHASSHTAMQVGAYGDGI